MSVNIYKKYIKSVCSRLFMHGKPLVKNPNHLKRYDIIFENETQKANVKILGLLSLWQIFYCIAKRATPSKVGVEEASGCNKQKTPKSDRGHYQETSCYDDPWKTFHNSMRKWPTLLFCFAKSQSVPHG